MIDLVKKKLELPLYKFPIENYSQNAYDYFDETDESLSKNLLSNSYQQLQFRLFYRHYYASDEDGLEFLHNLSKAQNYKFLQSN